MYMYMANSVEDPGRVLGVLLLPLNLEEKGYLFG